MEILNCPHCHAEIEAEDIAIGDVIDCPFIAQATDGTAGAKSALRGLVIHAALLFGLGLVAGSIGGVF